MKMRVKSHAEIMKLRPLELPSFSTGMANFCGKVLDFEKYHNNYNDEKWLTDHTLNGGYIWREEWITPVNKITVNLHRGRKW